MSNNNYILTPDGNFISEDELYHHGVKGMKWGVRKMSLREDSAVGKLHKRKSRKEQLEDQAAYRVGGKDAVRRNDQRRERKRKEKVAANIKAAKGMKKVALILQEIGHTSTPDYKAQERYRNGHNI